MNIANSTVAYCAVDPFDDFDQSDVTDYDKTGSSIHFVAASKTGEVGVSIYDSNGSLDSLSHIRSRLELYNVERVIRALEDSLGLSLDLIPVDVEPAAPLVLDITVAKNCNRKVSIRIPKEMWSQTTDLVRVFEESGFVSDWPVYYGKLLLVKLPLSIDDLHALKVKSTILIPDSFSKTAKNSWTPKLIFPAMEGCIEGQFDPQQMYWRATSDFTSHVLPRNCSQSPEQEYADVICYCHLSSKECLNNRDQISVAVNALLNDLGCTIQCNDGKIATGVLMRIGQGIGIHITQISDSFNQRH